MLLPDDAQTYSLRACCRPTLAFASGQRPWDLPPSCKLLCVTTDDFTNLEVGATVKYQSGVANRLVNTPNAKIYFKTRHLRWHQDARRPPPHAAARCPSRLAHLECSDFLSPPTNQHRSQPTATAKLACIAAAAAESDINMAAAWAGMIVTLMDQPCGFRAPPPDRSQQWTLRSAGPWEARHPIYTIDALRFRLELDPIPLTH